MIIMKFGGSSLSNADTIKRISGIIEANLSRRPVIVLSAIGNTTDALMNAGRTAMKGQVDFDSIRKNHEQIAVELGIDPNKINEFDLLFDELKHILIGISLLRELTPKTNDYLVSFGERLSVRLFATYFDKKIAPAAFYDAWDIGFITDSRFTNAELLRETYENVAAFFDGPKIDRTRTPFVTGFIAKDRDENITTLGRGGSDMTATVIGVALKVREIQFWKDVNGIMTTDPRLVPNAYPVRYVSFDEAAELAYSGSDIMHPRSINPVKETGIPVTIKNSHEPDHPGTEVVRKLPEDRNLIRSISCKKGIILVDIISPRMRGQYGFLAKIFDIFGSYGISIDLVATSEISVSLTLDHKDEIEGLRKDLEEIADVNILRNKTIISLIGDVKHSSKILEHVFHVLNDKKINVQMISQGASKVNISLIVDDDEAEGSLHAIHEIFFEREGD